MVVTFGIVSGVALALAGLPAPSAASQVVVTGTTLGPGFFRPEGKREKQSLYAQTMFISKLPKCQKVQFSKKIIIIIQRMGSDKSNPAMYGLLKGSFP